MAYHLRSPAGERAVSTLISRNITVAGRRTSIRLERAMWDALEELCARQRMTPNQVATELDRHACESTLTASIRVYVLGYFRAAASEDGHRAVGHGPLRRAPPLSVA
jgi:predicted DNA-binding ribbon-helix-helix protein